MRVLRAIQRPALGPALHLKRTAAAGNDRMVCCGEPDSGGIVEKISLISTSLQRGLASSAILIQLFQRFLGKALVLDTLARFP